MRIAKTNTIPKRPVNKPFAVENTYYGTNQRDKAGHKEKGSPSPAVLWIVNIREKKNRDKKIEFYFVTSKNSISEYDGWRAS